jgi:hypothetical protein
MNARNIKRKEAEDPGAQGEVKDDVSGHHDDCDRYSDAREPTAHPCRFSTRQVTTHVGGSELPPRARGSSALRRAAGIESSRAFNVTRHASRSSLPIKRNP